MGMDLLPRHKDAESIHYNWSGWGTLIGFLDNAGVDTSEFDGCNDGKPICAATCRAVADAIKTEAAAYNATYGGTPKPLGYGDDPASDHAKAWRQSGGMRQW